MSSWTGYPPRIVVYQSDATHTIIVFTYNGKETGTLDHIQVFPEYPSRDFRIQAVEGYFYQSSSHNYFDAVFEGEGSAFTEFTITIPATSDKPGTSKPNISLPPNTPTPSESSNTPSQNLLWIHITIMLTTVCIIALTIAIVTYLNKQRKTSSTKHFSRSLLKNKNSLHKFNLYNCFLQTD